MPNKCEECYYYGRLRYGKVCNFDGTWNPVTQEGECINFTALETLETMPVVKACCRCVWRNYGGSLMVCDNPTIRGYIQAGRIVNTPCEFFELDETGDEYLMRIKEGYSWVKTERTLRS